MDVLMLPAAPTAATENDDRNVLETLLNRLEAKWQREEKIEDGVPRIVYFVCGGELHGWWEASIERDILEKMVTKLTASWERHFDACKLVGGALRSIDR